MSTSQRPDLDWQHLVQEHSRSLRRVVARRVEADAVDDVIQETFLRAYRSRHCLDSDRPVGPWLRTIAIRVAADTSARARTCFDGPSGAVAADAASEYASAERVALIRKALGLLNPRHRQLLEAVALDGTAQAAIAEREGVAPEVIRSTVLRARRRFRAVYERLAQDHGLVGVGSSIKPTLARLRARLVPLDQMAVGKPEFAAAVVALLAVGPLALVENGGLKTEATDSTISQRVAREAQGEQMAVAASHAERSSLDVRVVTSVPGDDLGGSVTDKRLPAVGTFWTLRVAAVDVEVTMGTEGSMGYVTAGRRTTQDGQKAQWAGVESEVQCSPGTLSTSEVQCRSFEYAGDHFPTIE